MLPVEGPVHPDPGPDAHHDLLHPAPVDLVAGLLDLAGHLDPDTGILPPRIDQDVLATRIRVQTVLPRHLDQ